MCKFTWCMNCLLLLLFLLFCCHCCTSFPNDVGDWTLWHNNQFDVEEAAAPTAPMPRSMLIIASLEEYHWLPGTIPYIFLCRTQPTINPQCPTMRCDLNGQQRLPWCLTPGAAADKSCPECWWIVVCGGARSWALWRQREDSSSHGWWGTV